MTEEMRQTAFARIRGSISLVAAETNALEQRIYRAWVHEGIVMANRLGAISEADMRLLGDELEVAIRESEKLMAEAETARILNE